MAVIDANGAVAQFKQVSRMPVARQLTLLIGLAASVALGVGVVLWSQGTDYAPLYGELAGEDAAAVAQSLEQAGVKYEMDRRTGMINVPVDQVHQMRMKLAGEGLPRGEGKGFEMLYQEQEIGISSFMEKARYDRALEQELARTISAMESVKAARVHLAIPKQSAFVRRDKQAQASVLVNLYPGRELTERQLMGIAHMVSSSVPGLMAENVSVVDQLGRLLSEDDPDNEFIYSQEQFRITQQLEDNYANRIVQILAPMVGASGVRAQVTADMDFTLVEKTSESYAPDAAVRSEQLVEELSRGAGQQAAGIPGTLSNQPPANPIATNEPPEPQLAEATEEPSSSAKREVRNYELDRTVSHIKEAPGLLKRLSVAVLVDYREVINAEGVVERQPIPQEELDRMTALVRDAIGYDEARGDSVNVMNSSFLQPAAVEPLPEPSFLEQAWVWRAGRMVLAALAIFFLIFGVIRPVMRSSAAGASAVPAIADGGTAAGMAQLATQPVAGQVGEEQVTLSSGQPQAALQQPVTPLHQQLGLARSVAEEQPERAAHIVKNWVTQDG